MKGSVTGHYVAVRPDDVAETDPALSAAKRMGFIIDDKETSRSQAATTTGIVLSVGQQAFKAFTPDHNGPKWADVGDKVAFVRHASKIIDDTDEVDDQGKPKKVFVMTDENIIWNFSIEEEK